MNKEEARSAVMEAISMTLKDSILQQGFTCICKELADFQKENAELRHQLNKNPCVKTPEWHCSDCLKENAELKAKNKWYSEQVCNKECAEVWGNLTKAKEIIKDFILVAKVEHLKDRYETVDEAEQFISEVEK